MVALSFATFCLGTLPFLDFKGFLSPSNVWVLSYALVLEAGMFSCSIGELVTHFPNFVVLLGDLFSL